MKVNNVAIDCLDATAMVIKAVKTLLQGICQ
jgi:hypothetical protein